MATRLHPKFPYRVRQEGSSELWGVWDNRHSCWAQAPAHRRLFAERMTRAMILAFAAGAADAVIEKVR